MRATKERGPGESGSPVTLQLQSFLLFPTACPQARRLPAGPPTNARCQMRFLLLSPDRTGCSHWLSPLPSAFSPLTRPQKYNQYAIQVVSYCHRYHSQEHDTVRLDKLRENQQPRMQGWTQEDGGGKRKWRGKKGHSERVPDGLNRRTSEGPGTSLASP